MPPEDLALANEKKLPALWSSARTCRTCVNGAGTRRRRLFIEPDHSDEIHLCLAKAQAVRLYDREPALFLKAMAMERPVLTIRAHPKEITGFPCRCYVCRSIIRITWSMSVGLIPS